MSLLKKGLAPVASSWRSFLIQQFVSLLSSDQFKVISTDDESGDYFVNSAGLFTFLGMGSETTAVMRIEQLQQCRIDSINGDLLNSFDGEAVFCLDISDGGSFYPHTPFLFAPGCADLVPVSFRAMPWLHRSLLTHCAQMTSSLSEIDWAGKRTGLSSLIHLNELATEMLKMNLERVKGLTGYIVIEAIDALPDGEIYVRIGELQLCHADSYFHVSISGEFLLDEVGVVSGTRFSERCKYAQLGFGYAQQMPFLSDQFLVSRDAGARRDQPLVCQPSLHNRELFVQQFACMLIRDIGAHFCKKSDLIIRPAVHPVNIRKAAGFGFRPFFVSKELQEDTESAHSLGR